MLEVCERFKFTIREYQALPPGDKILYNEYTKIKIEAETKSPALKLK